MDSECEECEYTCITVEDFEENHGKEDFSVTYHEWKTVEKKVQKITLSVDAEDAAKLLDKGIQIVKRNIFVKEIKMLHTIS